MAERMAVAIYFASRETDSLPMEECRRYVEAIIFAMQMPTPEIEEISTSSIHYSASEIWQMMIDAIKAS